MADLASRGVATVGGREPAERERAHVSHRQSNLNEAATGHSPTNNTDAARHTRRVSVLLPKAKRVQGQYSRGLLGESVPSARLRDAGCNCFLLSESPRSNEVETWRSKSLFTHEETSIKYEYK